MTKTNGISTAPKQEQNQETIQLTLPDLNTPSQVNQAVRNVTDPLRRIRAT